MKKNIPTFLPALSLLAFVALIAPAPLRAQAEGGKSDEPLSPEQLKTGIANLQTHIDQREQRATDLTNDIIQLDGRIEDRVQKIVDMLKSITDSEDSQVRAATTKQRVIDGLKKSIEYYDRMRRELKSETMQRSPKITREELFGDIGKFDEHIEKRVDQIIDLANSLYTHEDVNKWIYSVDDDSYRGRYYDYSRYRNPEYYHNRKQTTRTEQEKEQLVEELKGSIDGLDRRNRSIQETLKKSITPQYREMLETEFEKNRETIDIRESQIGDLTTSAAPALEEVGRTQMHRMEQLIDDMAEDIQGDFNDLFRKYAELNQERAAIKSLSDDQAKFQKMLEEAGK